jgi:hypothetical protein
MRQQNPTHSWGLAKTTWIMAGSFVHQLVISMQSPQVIQQQFLDGLLCKAPRTVLAKALGVAKIDLEVQLLSTPRTLP